MSANSATPDSWESIDQRDGEANLQKFGGLSISAKPFVPNINATAFVPNFGPKPPAPTGNVLAKLYSDESLYI